MDLEYEFDNIIKGDVLMISCNYCVEIGRYLVDYLGSWEGF